MTRIKTNKTAENPDYESTPQQDRELLDGVAAGSPEAGKEFVDRWGRLAHEMGYSAAGRLRSRTGVVDVEDLVQDAYESMLEDAQRYDSEGGAKFSSYTMSFMPQRLAHKVFEGEHGVHVPRNIQDRLRAIDSENAHRYNMGRRILSDTEIAEMFNMPVTLADANGRDRVTVTDLHNTRGMSKFIGSIDEEGFSPGQDESPGQGYEVSEVRPMQSVVGDTPKTTEELAEESALRQKLEEVLDSLDEREREIVKLHHGFDDDNPLTDEEIGKEYDISPLRVRHILSKAHSKLRHPHRSERLKDFTDD